MGFGRSELTAGEQELVAEAERAERPFAIYRDAAGSLELSEFEGDRVCIGRGNGNDLMLPWEFSASRLHARLELLGGEWTIVDDGLPRNGTFVNGQRLLGRRRLEDHDVLLIGETEILYRNPAPGLEETPHIAGRAATAGVSPAQKRVLVALCRPLLESQEQGAIPSSNAEIASALSITSEAVRFHLKSLFRLYELPDLPQNRKRAELARRALASGVVLPRDLDDR